MKSKLETWEKKKRDLEGEIVKLEEYLNSLPPKLDELLTSTNQVTAWICCVFSVATHFLLFSTLHIIHSTDIFLPTLRCKSSSV